MFWLVSEVQINENTCQIRKFMEKSFEKISKQCYLWGITIFPFRSQIRTLRTVLQSNNLDLRIEKSLKIDGKFLLQSSYEANSWSFNENIFGQQARREEKWRRHFYVVIDHFKHNLKQHCALICNKHVIEIFFVLIKTGLS